MTTIITLDNFAQFVGKIVRLDWTCREGGIMYPERNILLGMNSDFYYLQANEEDEEKTYWHVSIADGSSSDETCLYYCEADN